jgi:hypothetical protein
LVSRGIVVLLPALVKGMGHESQCEVLTRRRGSDPGPAYSDCTIIGAPDDLPDGEYVVEFENVLAATTRYLGVWANFSPRLKGTQKGIEEEPEALVE